MGSTSLWQAELNAAHTSHLAISPLQETCETDIAIVGAGITGTATALWLARAGAQVRVLEGRRIAAGASGRNGGILATGTTEPYATTITRYGRAHARRIWAFSVSNSNLAASLIEELNEHGWQCGYRRNGRLKLAASEVELDDIRASASLLQEDGWGAELMERQELPERLRGSYYGGSYHSLSAEIQPARFVAGLAHLAQQAGAVFYDESPVSEITIDEKGVLLNTPQGKVRARTLVLATNAWLPEIGSQIGANWLSRCISPTRGQVLATEPIRETLFPCPCSANEGYQYWRQLNDGRLVVGGWRNCSFATEATMDETPSEEIQRHLDAFVHETLNLPEIGIEHRWAGIMAFSADSLPLVGRLPGVQHCYISAGYTGHGNAYAILAAQVISELVLGRTHPDADLFDPARFAMQG